ncbi:hypothetical protein K8B33_05465 [Alcanivorax sp. JB21]|uniref:hypothetical protein n=1 Tax=Alcanivorax limicola TaxID=2874102 RepID=UPI001CC05A37|nr:hypothetical protein [Alcanivorax limicola]MBZ2188533.1 hypothetical protein [Alcanivorax limicola]
MADSSKTGRRGRKPSEDAERKDRVIQTRVPRDLETTLKDAAERERVSVSHLIRHVLEDTFNLVDNIVADSASLVGNVTRDAKRLAASARGERAPGSMSGSTSEAASPRVPAAQGGDEAAALLEAVDAWQDVIINRADHCVQCGVALKRGQRAFRGLSSIPGAPAVWLCGDCITTL